MSGLPENHKATMPAFNVGPPSARLRNAITMAFRWRADDCPFIAVFGSSIPHQLKKKRYQIWTPPTKLSGSAHEHYSMAMDGL